MIKIICVGKLKEKYLNDLVLDYKNRISKYHKIEIVNIKDSDINGEEELILKNINEGEYVITMDIHGKKYDSIGFKDKIVSLFNNSISNITFIIGGSDGTGDKVKKRSQELISFSDMTFPHGLFRGLLLEQIYRSFKIINNESYHK